MPSIVNIAPPADNGLYPPSFCQFGDKYFVCYGDQRPLYLLASQQDSTIKAYPCGVKPPIGYPTATASATNAINLVYDTEFPQNNDLYFTYIHWSSVRGAPSQMSPVTKYTIPAPTAITGTVSVTLGSTAITGSGSNWDPDLTVGDSYQIEGVVVTIAARASDTSATLSEPWPGASDSGLTIYNLSKAITVGSFFEPREDAIACDIDTVYVGVQYGLLSGYMCVLPTMSVKAVNGSFSGTTVTFDLSQQQLLNGGFDLATLSQFAFIPPASKYISRYGERVFYGGQRDVVTLSDVGMAAVKAALTGTVTLTNGSAGVTGSSTLFTTELTAFDALKFYGDGLGAYSGEAGTHYFAGTITNATTLTMTSAYNGLTNAGITAKRVYRDEAFARLQLTPGTTGAWTGFDDSHYHLNVFVNGQFLGKIWDVASPTVAYLDRDIPANIASTVDFYMTGDNNAAFPSAWTNYTSGNTPTPIPECIQLADARPLVQATDEGQQLMGLQTDGEFLYIIFNDTTIQMLAGNEINSPLNPVYRPLQGRVGAIAPRSICKDNVQRMAWIGEEGICVGNSGGIDSISHALGCDLLWGKSSRWIDKTTLPDIVMTYARSKDGYVFGGFKINSTTLTGTLACTHNSGAVTGTSTLFLTELAVYDVIEIFEIPYMVTAIASNTAMTITTFISGTGTYTATKGTGWWGLFSVKPQEGIWLFSGQVITSNLIEYQDANGQGVILGGSKPYGSVRQYLVPDTYLDEPVDSGAAIAYYCRWREGWISTADGQQSTLDTIKIPGLLVPGDAIGLTINHWHDDYPQRDEALISTQNQLTNYVESIGQLRFDIPLMSKNATRYHSVEVQMNSYNLNVDLTAQPGPPELARLQEFLGTTGE